MHEYLLITALPEHWRIAMKLARAGTLHDAKHLILERSYVVRDFGCRWKQWILVAATSEGACLQIRHTVKVVLAFTEVGGFSRRFLTPVSSGL